MQHGWTVFLELFFFNTSQSLFHHVKLELKPAGFHPAFICASLERVNKELCPDCYLRTMLGDGFVLSQLSLALRLIIVQVYASNDTYHLLPNPWDSLWKASAWNI